MQNSTVQWATLTHNSKGPNPIKRILDKVGYEYRYANDGYESFGSACTLDFGTEYGCNGFDDFAIEIQTSVCATFSLHPDTVYFELEESTILELTRSKSFDTLMKRRVKLIGPEDDYRSNPIVCVRVEHQYHVSNGASPVVARWGYVCRVYHYYDNHD